jgi:hypothetical protein
MLPKVTEYTVIKGSSTTTLQAGTAQAPTFNFTMGQFTVGTGFYDQYKFEAIRFTITPQQNAIGLFTNSTSSAVPIYCVIDYDDSTALSSVGAAAGYANCVIINPGESCERVFKPHMALAAYSGTFASYANVVPTWIDSASSSVQHYGIKLYIPAITVGQTQVQDWNVTVEAFVALRKSI